MRAHVLKRERPFADAHDRSVEERGQLDDLTSFALGCRDLNEDQLALQMLY